MYNAILEKVTRVIEQTSKTIKVEGEDNEMYNYLFNPEAYLKTQEAKRKREENKQKVIVAITLVAAVGEVIHLARRTNVIGKIKNLKR